MLKQQLSQMQGGQGGGGQGGPPGMGGGMPMGESTPTSPGPPQIGPPGGGGDQGEVQKLIQQMGPAGPQQ